MLDTIVIRIDDRRYRLDLAADELSPVSDDHRLLHEDFAVRTIKRHDTAGKTGLAVSAPLLEETPSPRGRLSSRTSKDLDRKCACLSGVKNLYLSVCEYVIHTRPPAAESRIWHRICSVCPRNTIAVCSTTFITKPRSARPCTPFDPAGIGERPFTTEARSQLAFAKERPPSTVTDGRQVGRR